MKKVRFSLVLAASVLGISMAFAGPITPGNVVVVRLGDGVATLSGSTASINLVEYTPAGVEVQAIAIPSTGVDALTIGGTTTTEGNLNLSADGKYITMAGYALAAGTASPAAVANVRAIARVTVATGAVDTTTKIDNVTLASATSIRGAVTDDGTRFWVSTGDRGVVYASSFGTTQAGLAITGGTGNLRAISIFGGQLYVNSGGSATSRAVASVGTGLPTTAGQTLTVLNGMAQVTGSAYQFQFDTASRLFVGEITTNPGLQEWTETAGTWSNASTAALTSPSSVGVAVGMDDVTPTVYLTTGPATGATLQKTPKVSPLGALTTIATAPTNTVFRGLVYVPVAPASVDDWTKY